MKLNKSKQRLSPKKAFCKCCYHIWIKTAVYMHAYLPKTSLKYCLKLKKKKNFHQTLQFKHSHYLKFEYTQLNSHYSPLPKHKPLLLLHIDLFHISSQIKCYSSQFLETPRAAEKHTQSSRGR